MSITKNVLLNWYCSMKFFFWKIQIIFDKENWLWKSKFCNFWPCLLNWTQDLDFFIGLVIGLEHIGRPCKMCDSVWQKLGHANVLKRHMQDIIESFPTWKHMPTSVWLTYVLNSIQWNLVIVNLSPIFLLVRYVYYSETVDSLCCW